PQGREAAVAAALAAFDELDTGRLPGASPSVVPLRSRRRGKWMQGLTAAAAAAVVVVGGIVIANRDGDDDTSTADREREPAVAAPATPGVAPTTAPFAPTTTAQSEIAATDDLGAGAPAEEAEEAEDDAADAPPQAAAPAPPTTGGEPTATTTSAAPMLAESAEELPVLRSPADLTALASARDEPPPPLDDVVEACEDSDVEADAVYEDERGTREDVVVATAGEGYAAVSVEACEAVLIAGG
ncbi:MAG: hypothetical protein ACRD0G_15275, partial [Acidimicrobiales bacterium]